MNSESRTALSAPRFLREAALHFRSRDTHGEDMAHWSNIYNAENCERIASEYEDMLAALKAALPVMIDDMKDGYERDDKADAKAIAMIRTAITKTVGTQRARYARQG